MGLELRRVKEEDCDVLFDWANDETVRQNAFNTHLISYSEHEKWFRSKLNSDSCIIFILCFDNKPIGQIRVDVEGMDSGIISYSIERNFRGHGYGSFLLTKVFDEIKQAKFKVNILKGKVKYDNIASKRAFEKANFSYTLKDDYIEYYKTI